MVQLIAPVEESLAPEHGSELLAHALEHLLDGSGVAQEGGRHLEALWRDVTDLHENQLVMMFTCLRLK